jgi:hypothetical protein
MKVFQVFDNDVYDAIMVVWVQGEKRLDLYSDWGIQLSAEAGKYPDYLNLFKDLPLLKTTVAKIRQRNRKKYIPSTEGRQACFIERAEIWKNPLTGGVAFGPPSGQTDEYALVHWQFDSGTKGKVKIYPRDAEVIATGKSNHPEIHDCYEQKEVLAILKPGQEMWAERTGLIFQENRAVLRYSGKNVSVRFVVKFKEDPYAAKLLKI